LPEYSVPSSALSLSTWVLWPVDRPCGDSSAGRPRCGKPRTAYHAGYVCTARDVPILGYPVSMSMLQRRFTCFAYVVVFPSIDIYSQHLDMIWQARLSATAL